MISVKQRTAYVELTSQLTSQNSSQETSKRISDFHGRGRQFPTGINVEKIDENIYVLLTDKFMVVEFESGKNEPKIFESEILEGVLGVLMKCKDEYLVFSKKGIFLYNLDLMNIKNSGSDNMGIDVLPHNMYIVSKVLDGIYRLDDFVFGNTIFFKILEKTDFLSIQEFRILALDKAVNRLLRQKSIASKCL